MKPMKGSYEVKEICAFQVIVLLQDHMLNVLLKLIHASEQHMHLGYTWSISAVYIMQVEADKC